MPVQRSHGKPRPQVPRADELAAPVLAPAGVPIARDPKGRVQKGTSGARELAKRGGQAKARRRALAKLAGLFEPPEDHPYRPYHELGAQFRDHHLAELAAVAGGQVGSGPASIVATAAVQLADSRWLRDLALQTLGDPKLIEQASKLADASRQNLLSAYELANREAKARPAKNPHEAVFAAFGGSK